ncbi:MAG: hypothetical protein HY063_11375 [Bacteroidetes bacterium]|nr:hypothetical protein [Bacteroidota bacterium]
MNILLDECVPAPLKQFLANHHVKTASEMGWSSLKNGKLLEASIKEGFDVLLTIDKNIHHQQNIKSLRITVIVFDIARNKVEFFKPLLPKFFSMLDTLQKGKVYIIK